MKKISFFLSLCMLYCMSISAATVTYTADNTSIFKNPERGFTEEMSREVSDSRPHVILDEDYEGFFEETGNTSNGYPTSRPTQTLAMVLYNLKNYRTKDLSNKVLQGFNEDMQELRNKGFKCVLRFAYSEDDCHDAPIARVQSHLAQLKPYLQANADVIYVMETGFVGEWGEWYYTENFGNYCDDNDDPTQHLDANRRAVVDAVLDALPSNRFVLVRYPHIKVEYLGSTSNPNTTPLTATQAFAGDARSRLGFHNDAFLNTYGNEGTYAGWDMDDDDSQEVRQYIASETLYVPNGGETNVEGSSLAKKVYNQAESEMATYHWSFCGESYAEEVTKRWHQNGIFDNLNRKMGYRFQLTTATFPTQANPGGKASITLNIKNVGYAPLYNERHAYIVLKNGNNKYQIQLQSDPRTWLPNDVVTNISEQITIPSNVPNATYQLYLYLPDASATIADDPRYAVRFANENVWDSSTGMNNLNASIQITGGAVTPDPELSVSATSVAFGEVTVGTAATKTFTVTGSNLTNNVTISSNNSLLNVSPSSLTPTQASNATITLSLTPAAAGNGSAVVTVASNGAASKTVNVTWTAKTSGGGDPTPSGDGTVIFHWRSDGSQPTAGTALTTIVGSLMPQTTDNSKSFSAESAGYVGTVPDDLKASGSKGVKFGANALFFTISPIASAGNFQTGDTIYICAYNQFKVSGAGLHSGNVVSSMAGGADKSSYAVASFVIGAGVSSASLNIERAVSSGSGLAAIKVVRPGQSSGGGGDPTPGTDIVIDGNFDDWSDLSNLAHAEGSAGLFGMRWYANETDIFYYLEYDAQTAHIDILLSTDGNTATGHDSWFWSPSGAEYLIEGEPDAYADAWLAVFDDNLTDKGDWDNGWIDSNIEDYQICSASVALANGHKALEGKISQAKLAAITELRVGVFLMDAGWNEAGSLPQGTGGSLVPMLEVPIYKTPTAIDVLKTTDSAHKILRNGQLLIIRDGKIYTVQGQIYE